MNKYLFSSINVTVIVSLCWRHSSSSHRLGWACLGRHLSWDFRNGKGALCDQPDRSPPPIFRTSRMPIRKPSFLKWGESSAWFLYTTRAPSRLVIYDRGCCPRCFNLLLISTNESRHFSLIWWVFGLLILSMLVFFVILLTFFDVRSKLKLYFIHRF